MGGDQLREFGGEDGEGLGRGLANGQGGDFGVHEDGLVGELGGVAQKQMIVVQCDRTPLATRYRGRMLIVGVETKYRLVFSGTDPMGSIAGVEPGVTVQIIMQAVNESSQSVASDPVIFTMPGTAAKAEPAAAAEEELAPLAAISSNGNGSTNGNRSSLAVSRA